MHAQAFLIAHPRLPWKWQCILPEMCFCEVWYVFAYDISFPISLRLPAMTSSSSVWDKNMKETTTRWVPPGLSQCSQTWSWPGGQRGFAVLLRGSWRRPPGSSPPWSTPWCFGSSSRALFHGCADCPWKPSNVTKLHWLVSSYLK